MKNDQEYWYTQQKLLFPSSMNHATALTRTGTPSNRRDGGPGTRSKNPARYGRIGAERANG